MPIDYGQVLNQGLPWLQRGAAQAVQGMMGPNERKLATDALNAQIDGAVKPTAPQSPGAVKPTALGAASSLATPVGAASSAPPSGIGHNPQQAGSIPPPAPQQQAPGAGAQALGAVSQAAPVAGMAMGGPVGAAVGAGVGMLGNMAAQYFSKPPDREPAQMQFAQRQPQRMLQSQIG